MFATGMQLLVACNYERFFMQLQWIFATFLGVYVSQPHFGLSVRVKPTLPKVGSWSPPGLPKTQSAISGVKSPHIWALLVLMERSSSVDVQNGHLQPKLWAKEGPKVKLPV